ncbi:hypothetical protein EU509_19905 [Pseudoalteromonas fuliginea]|uniref:Uncharacterized protein n=1 Tax=Pseudoalteromonas fuliginea TaxID=1872678 RepID=A0ABQ6RCX8_9GAMM|nr:hypothetical protein EU509_19905 [Pseudoalteromonas fuliginea]KAA1165126.1 hypothetical protein EUZ79_19890 [Pseudoalteromonas fuliginea]
MGLMFIVGEVLYLAFYKVKLHEREINSHLQVKHHTLCISNINNNKMCCRRRACSREKRSFLLL